MRAIQPSCHDHDFLSAVVLKENMTAMVGAVKKYTRGEQRINVCSARGDGSTVPLEDYLIIACSPCNSGDEISDDDEDDHERHGFFSDENSTLDLVDETTLLSNEWSDDNTFLSTRRDDDWDDSMDRDTMRAKLSRAMSRLGDGTTEDIANDLAYSIFSCNKYDTFPDPREVYSPMNEPEFLAYDLVEGRSEDQDYKWVCSPRVCVSDAIIASTWEPSAPLILIKDQKPYYPGLNTTGSTDGTAEKPYVQGKVLITWQSRSVMQSNILFPGEINHSIEAIDMNLSSYAVKGERKLNIHQLYNRM